MKKQIYLIKDDIGQEFREMFLAPNEGIAIRQMTSLVNDDKKSDITENTADFKLYRAGEIDYETGEITAKLEFIKNLVELKRSKN